jgi:molybdate transport system regulatory protein
MKSPEIKVAYRIWLVSKGKAFGTGPYELLKGIEQTGSLRQAAIEMEMSYRKAWGLFRDCEKKLGFSLIDKKVGGLSGGYSRITPEGKEFMKSYEKFHSEVEESINKIFDKNIGKFIRSRKPG